MHGIDFVAVGHGAVRHRRVDYGSRRMTADNGAVRTAALVLDESDDRLDFRQRRTSQHAPHRVVNDVDGLFPDLRWQVLVTFAVQPLAQTFGNSGGLTHFK